MQGPHRAVQADYLISFEGAWASAKAASRVPGRVLRPHADRAFPPGLSTRRQASAGMRSAPGVAHLPGEASAGLTDREVRALHGSAPVCLGNYQTGPVNKTRFTAADFRRGGRQITSDLIEFYTTDDEPGIRIDFWLGSQPEIKGREPIFDAKLRVEEKSFSVWSFVEPYEVPIPSGEYDISITRLNRRSYSKRALTHAERFDRDDLERYEVLMRRRPTD